jgi:hypothetical protein
MSELAEDRTGQPQRLDERLPLDLRAQARVRTVGGRLGMWIPQQGV